MYEHTHQDLTKRQLFEALEKAEEKEEKENPKDLDYENRVILNPEEKQEEPEVGEMVKNEPSE